MASGSDQDKLIYVLKVLSHTDLPQPDYKTIAAETAQANGNGAQKKFKAILKSAGFDLVDRQVVPIDGNGSSVPKTPKKNVKAATKSTPASGKKAASGRKRKAEVMTKDEDDEDNSDSAGATIKGEAVALDNDEDDDVEVTGEKRIKRARSVTVKAEMEKQSRDEDEDDDTE